MVIDSKYAKQFVSNNLTRQKYDELYDFAVKVRDFKNKISKEVCSDLLKYLEYGRFQFLKEMRATHKEIPSSFDYQLYIQVLDCYQNKFDAIQRKLKFEKITYICCETYKRDTKKNKKGDFKKVNNKKSSTPLSTCLTYLARYGNESTIDYINSTLPTLTEDDKKQFYINILRCCEKYGFERLYNLAMSKRTRIIKKYSEKPIDFKSLTFSGRSRKTKIIDYNKNYNSEINAFVSLSGFGRKSMDIPVKFAKDYHGSMRDYMKKTNDYEYTITFNEKRHQVTVTLYKDGKRYIPEAGDNVIGIDVNVKHNLFSLSNETTYDYDRKLVNDFCKLCREIDRNKKNNKKYTVGKRKQFKLDTLRNKMKKSEEQLVSDMCKALKNEGVTHIVMEDLNNSFGKCCVKDPDNEDINYNRKVSFLNISSLKQMVEHIARKYDIAVSTVQASYTSKMCPICGCIEDENRPNQETFECVECGYKTNADFNAATNIKNRVCEAVLRNKLLKQLDNGAYEPKKLKREKVKEVLLSFRRNLQGTARSECNESSVTTFDYV